MQTAPEKPLTRLSILQETTVPQVFSRSVDQAIDARSISLGCVNNGKKWIAWTLSRGFWQ
jgi:hypothetical protein